MTTTAVRRRIMLALFSTQGLFTAAIIATFTISPILAAEMSGSDSAAGLPSTISLAGRALLAAPAGLLMDRTQRKRQQAIYQKSEVSESRKGESEP